MWDTNLPRAVGYPKWLALPYAPAPLALGCGRLQNFTPYLYCRGPSSLSSSHRQPMDVLYWTVFAAGTMFGLAPIWVSDLLPLLDAASHLHLISIIHEHARNPLYQHHYAQVEAVVPYLTYYKAVDWLAYVGGVEWANKVVLSLSLGALPVAALHLIRTAGHNRWLILAVFPWMLNSDFFMGFFNYLMSIPVFIWLLAEHIRFMRAPTWKRAAWIAILLVFMAVTHYLLWGITLVLLPLMALIFGGRHGWWQTVTWPMREALIVLPSLLVLLPWFLQYFVFAQDVVTADQASPHGATLLERIKYLYAGDHLTPLGNVKQIVDRMFDQFAQGGEHVRGVVDLVANRPGEVVTTLWLLGATLWVLGAIKSAVYIERDPDVASTERHTVSLPVDHDVIRVPSRGPAIPGTSYLGWTLALLACAYFILPQHLNRPIILYGVNFRLVEVLGILAACAIPVDPLRPRPHVRWRVWAGTACLAIAAVMMPLVTAGTFMLVRTEYGSARAAMAVIPPGKRVLTLRMTRESRWLKNAIFSNVGEYYAVFRHGYVPYSFADSSSKPMIARREHTIPAPLWYDHQLYSEKEHGKFFDYVVIFRGADEERGYWETTLRQWHLVYQHDRWQVYRNPRRVAWPQPTQQEQERLALAQMAVEQLLELVGLDRDPDYRLTSEGLMATWQREDARLSRDEKLAALEAIRDEEAARQARAAAGAVDVPGQRPAEAMPPAATPVDDPGSPAATGRDLGVLQEPTNQAIPLIQPIPAMGPVAPSQPAMPTMPPMGTDRPSPEMLQVDPNVLQRAMTGEDVAAPRPDGPPVPAPGTVR